MLLGGPTRPSRTNTKKRCPFHHRGLECKSRKSRDNWRDFPAVPVVETALTMKGAEVQSLVRELTSHMPQYGAKKSIKKKKEIPGITDKFGPGVQNEAGQRLTEFSQENTLIIANTLFQQHKKQLHSRTSPDTQY